MAERSQYQYQPVTGPVWREPVAEKLAWIPCGQQPARQLPPNRLGDYVRPEFAALYAPAGLQWSPSDRYAGQPKQYSLTRYTILDPTPPAPPFDAALLSWQTRGQQPARGLQPNRLGAFVRPEFEALYKAEGLQWSPSDRYAGRGLDRARNDWSVVPLPFAAPAYDPQNLEWSPRGIYPRVQVERRILGDFQQPPFAALYDPQRLEWQSLGQAPARTLPRGVFDWTIAPVSFAAPPYNPQTLEWVLQGTKPRVTVEWRAPSSVAQPIFAPLYNPQGLQWQALDRYAGRSLARARFDSTIFLLPIVAPTIPNLHRLYLDLDSGRFLWRITAVGTVLPSMLEF